MDFFYKEEIEVLKPSCPPISYTNIETICFRWVFEDIANKENFKAQAEKNPKALNSKSDMDKCDYYALSFHNTEENSVRHFKFLSSNVKNAYKRLGTNIAVGKIEENDGVSSNVDKIGHFNFHPIKNHNFNTKFEIISKL